MSVSSISIEDRKKTLGICHKLITKELKKQDFSSEYEVEIQNVLHMIEQTMKSNLNNAIVISEEDLNWLRIRHESYDEREEQRRTKSIKKQSSGIKVISKFYDKDKIIGYRLTDGKTVKDIKSTDLKQAIMQGKIRVDNVTLTTDGRIYTTDI